MRSLDVRQIILDQSKRANVGHIGSALSIADIITCLYSNILNVTAPDEPDRDRFVLSKGHAALALYAALYLKGWLSSEQLNSYCSNESLLGVHPEHQLTGVDFSSGSLGQGLSTAAGAALAARLQNSKRRVFVIMSDAECNEGSVWEAAMFAAHNQLSNLVVLIDLNGQQALGYTRDVLNLSPMAERWRSFGWNAYDVNGHDDKQMTALIKSLSTQDSAPHVLVAHTTFGKGVSFMENQIKWHYLPMTEAEYKRARQEIEETVN